MLESKRQENLRMVRAFNRKDASQEYFEIAGRRVRCGQLRPSETLSIQEHALVDPRILKIMTSEKPVQQLANLLGSENGYRLLATICNIRRVDPDAPELTYLDILDSLESMDEAVELITVLTIGKTLQELHLEQVAADLDKDDEEVEEEAPKPSSPSEDT